MKLCFEGNEKEKKKKKERFKKERKMKGNKMLVMNAALYTKTQANGRCQIYYLPNLYWIMEKYQICRIVKIVKIAYF